MSKNVHEIFRDVPDDSAAQALSEFLLFPNDFKIISKQEHRDERGEFPPVPSYPTSVTISHLNSSNLARNSVLLPMGKWNEGQLVKAALNEYPFVETLQMMPEDGEGAVWDSPLDREELRIMAIDAANKSKFKTIGAFVVFSARDSHEHFPGLFVSNEVVAEISLGFRDIVRRSLAALDKIPEEIDDENFEQYKREILTNDPVAQTIAGTAAAMTLPSLERITEIHSDKVAAINKYAGMSRDERRKAQVDERRKLKRKRK